MNDVLQAARAYLADGISVVPVRRDGTKAAAVPWKLYESRLPTEDELRRWFGRLDPYGIALVGGAVSGCLEQLDFDREAVEIFPSWCELVDSEQPGLSDELHVVETPRGGYHVRYRVPGLKVPGNCKLAIDPSAPAGDRVLIETRGEGGYALAPGSPLECHPSGRPYRHVNGPITLPEVTPAAREIMIRCARSFTREAKMPLRQVGLDLRPGDDFDRRGPDWSEILEPAGWRCVRQVGAVRYWRRPDKDGPGWSATTGHCHGKDGTELLRVFSSNAAPFEDGPGYGKFRAYAMLNHAGDLSAAADALSRQGYGNPRQTRPSTNGHGVAGLPATVPRPLAPYEPFPLSALPPVMRAYADAAAAAIGCDPALVALPCLAVAAGCIGNSRAVQLKRRWSEPPVIWAVTVVRSGGVKSAGWEAAVSPLWEREHNQWDAYRSFRKESEDAGEKPPKPPPARITSDATIQAVGELLRDNPRGVLLARDELDGWFQGFTRHQQNGASDRPHWLELHAARNLRLDRITRERGPLFVRRACCSVCGTIQRLVLARALDAEAMSAGLGARFLLAMPPVRKRVWTEADVATDLSERYAALLGTLLALPLADETKRKPHFLHLSPDAKALWVEWFNAWGELQWEAADDRAAVLAKLEGYAARLALVHQVAADAAMGFTQPREVGADAMRAGIRLAQWFAAEAERVYAALRETDAERKVRELSAWVEARGGRVTVTDLLNACRSRYPIAPDADAALSELVAAGLGEWERVATGGRPSKVFQLGARKSAKAQKPPGATTEGNGHPAISPDGARYAPESDNGAAPDEYE